MEGVGLAILAEVRTLAVNVKERWACYKDGPRRFATVDDNVVALLAVLGKIVGVTSANPDALRRETSGLFRDTVFEARDSVNRSSEMLDMYCSRAYGGSSSGGAAQIAKKVLRVFKEKSLVATLKEIEKETVEVKNTLQHLLTQLVVVLKTDTAENSVRKAIKDQLAASVEEGVRSMIQDLQCPSELFRPTFNAPILSGSVRLDFESEDMHGSSSSPEGQLKSLIFLSTSATTTTVTVARGASFPLHAVSGMAGVGKTMALIGVGHGENIQEHFKDGVLFMSLGAEADVEKISGELEDIMRATGATSSAAAVNSASSLAEAVSKHPFGFKDDAYCLSSMTSGRLPLDLKAFSLTYKVFLEDVLAVGLRYLLGAV